MLRPMLFAAVLCLLPKNPQCFIVPQDDAELDLKEQEPPSDDVAQFVLGSVSAQQLAEDDALLKTIVQDATGDGDDSELATETEALFLSTVLHLLGQGELYRDARIDAITAALRSAFLATTGKVDHDYIEKVLAVIREKDQQNRRLDEEHLTNILRAVLPGDHEFPELEFSFSSTPSSATG